MTNSGSWSELERLNRLQTVAETDGFTPIRYRQFATRIGATSQRILDVGCGTGRGGAVLRARFPKAVLDGVELVADRVARVPDGVYDKTFVGTLDSLNAPESYDAIVMGELIEHIPLDAVEPLLVSARGRLRIGGLLLLTTPNPHYALLKARSGGTVLGGAHVSVHCATALSQLLRHIGFALEGVHGSGRVSQFIGARGPLVLYGSYMIGARRRV